MEDEDTELLLTDEAPEIVEGEEVETPQEIDPESLSLDDDDIEEEGDDWPAKLRKRYKETQREIAILKRENETFKAASVQIEELPPEPDQADFDYDIPAWKEAHKVWRDKAIALGIQQATKPAPDEAFREQINNDVARLKDGLTKLPFPDTEEALGVVQQILPGGHVIAIAQVAKDSGKLLYALSKSPKKMRELAEISSLTVLGGAIRDIETELGMKTAKKPPAPASTIRGNATATTTDKRLVELEKEADTTGNRTNLIKYKKEKGLI